MHIEQLGAGPDLVMVHGWSMHSGVWRELAESLAQRFTIYLVDLPGHGNSDWQAGELQLDSLLNALHRRLPEQAVWLGWSLGGLIGLALAARYPESVSKLIMLAATPLFVARSDWPCAVDAAVFEDFAKQLDRDQTQTIKRFLMLQARGAEHSRETIRQLSEKLATQHRPHPQALHAGLDLLMQQDGRQQLAELGCPLKMIIGDRDTLIPAEMLTKAKFYNPEIDASVIAGAGHAPFISHPTLCQQQIEHFIYG